MKSAALYELRRLLNAVDGPASGSNATTVYSFSIPTVAAWYVLMTGRRGWDALTLPAR